MLIITINDGEGIKLSDGTEIYLRLPNGKGRRRRLVIKNPQQHKFEKLRLRGGRLAVRGEERKIG